VWFHLRFAALVSVAWVLLLALRPFQGAAELAGILSTAGAVALAVTHVALAGLFWWGSVDPPRRRIAVWVGLATFLGRSILGIYLVLYAMEGAATMIVLVEMVLSIGLLSAMINALPGVVRPEPAPPRRAGAVR
jgi:hypothetical protein